MRALNDKAASIFLHMINGLNEGESRNLTPDGSPYMRTVVEHLTADTYSLTHYREQNGDQIADPDVEFWRDSATGRFYPYAYQDTITYHRSVEFTRGVPTHVDTRSQADLAIFCNDWLPRVNEQLGLGEVEAPASAEAPAAVRVEGLILGFLAELIWSVKESEAERISINAIGEHLKALNGTSREALSRLGLWPFSSREITGLSRPVEVSINSGMIIQFRGDGFYLRVFPINGEYYAACLAVESGTFLEALSIASLDEIYVHDRALQAELTEAADWFLSVVSVVL